MSDATCDRGFAPILRLVTADEVGEPVDCILEDWQRSEDPFRSRITGRGQIEFCVRDRRQVIELH